MILKFQKNISDRTISKKIRKYLISCFVFIIFFACFNNNSQAEKKEELPAALAVVLNKVNRLIRQKEFNRSIDILEKFRKKKDTTSNDVMKKGYDHHLIHFTLGNLYFMTENLPQAAENFALSVEKNPPFSSGWQNLAKCYYDLKKFERAGESFYRGYQTSPEKEPELLYYSALSFLAANNFKKGILLLEELMASHMEKIKTEWKEGAANAYLSNGQPYKALSYLEEIVRETKGEKQNQWHEMLLHQYISLKMDKKALSYAKWLTKEDPLYHKWWKALSYIYLSSDKHEDALAALMVYSYLNPLSIEEKKLIADLNFNLGIPSQAVNYYENILSEKKDMEYFKLAANSYQQLEQPLKALEILDIGLELRMHEPLLLMKGRLLYELERYGEAKGIFQKTVDLNDHNGEAWLMLGYSAFYVEDFKDAQKAFEKALTFSKQKNAAKEAILQLTQVNEIISDDTR